MYANEYRLLKDIATLAFKTDAIELINGSKTVAHQPQPGKTLVAVFGKGWGGELRLPGRPQVADESGRRIGSVFVDWILARLDSDKSSSNLLRLKCKRWTRLVATGKSAART